ncbi:hypothetical protein BDV97DRAFT_403377 [Delphinella strobiligena]|nr:hypothetical protein BDV97DRAFT_403377 [Delphinella strobiligena]
MPASQLRPIGVTMLAYIDSVIANKQDTIPELDEKLALATSKRLQIVDFCNNCGIVGIGVGQLTPDCEIVILDASGDHAIIETNIRDMFPAMQSSVEYGHVNSKTSSNGCEHGKANGLGSFDPLLVRRRKCASCSASFDRALGKLTSRDYRPRAKGCSQRWINPKDAIVQAGGTFCGRVHPRSVQDGPSDPLLSSNEDVSLAFNIDVYRGKASPSRAVRRIREQQE